MRVGVLGGGQLGRMLALAGLPLGISCRVFDPSPDACAAQVAEHVCASFDDEEALERFALGLDVVTLEWENVPVPAVRFLERIVPVRPGPEALATAQDRFLEKALFQKLGVATAPFAAVDSREGLESAVRAVGLPAVLKTRRLGYDGRGQRVLQARSDVEHAWEALGGVPLLLEAFVPFARELSIVALRAATADGGRDEQAFYPLAENVHEEGILRLSRAPAPGLTPSLQAEAEDIAERVMEATRYVGVIAVELFEHDGRLLANELAPRVHNSGHWTIEGAETSQFENHLRAVSGLPLGSTAARGRSAMANLIGWVPPIERLLAVAGAHVHLYGKEPRPGRKLGHVTLRGEDPAAIETSLTLVRLAIENVRL